MANSRRGETTIELGGGQYTLRFDFNALAHLEELTGTPLTQLGNAPPGVRFIRAAVYCGLEHMKLKGMTLEKIGRLLDPARLKEVGEVVGNALQASLGIEQDDVNEDEIELVRDPLAEGGASA